MQNKRHIGNFFEAEAEKFLLDIGYVTVDRNVYTPHGEIDLIMMKDACIYFVEVKYRKNNAYGTAREAIHKAKQLTLKKCAIHYIKTLENAYSPFKISFVGITQSGKSLEFDFIENIFS